ncbi:MAG: hypothetical protein LUF68_01225, partial [Clostridiales bacterium]|nr:hypothetical protein [Clostridiales bacterium]
MKYQAYSTTAAKKKQRATGSFSPHPKIRPPIWAMWPLVKSPDILYNGVPVPPIARETKKGNRYAE